MSNTDDFTAKDYDGIEATWDDKEQIEKKVKPSGVFKLISSLIVFGIIIIVATVWMTRFFSVRLDVDNPVNAGRQSVEALNMVEEHVGEYLSNHGQMPQYIGFEQLGMDQGELSKVPLVRTVSVLGGSAVDQVWTTVAARIRSDIDSPMAGHSVQVELEALLDTNGKPTGKFMSSCYVRGVNNQEPKIDLSVFPRKCQRTKPK